MSNSKDLEVVGNYAMVHLFFNDYPYKITKVTKDYIYVESEVGSKLVFSRVLYTQKHGTGIAYIKKIVTPEEVFARQLPTI